MRSRNPAPEGLMLFNLRVQADLTQDELAYLVNIHFTTISRWETGRHRPTVEHINLVCDVLHVNEATRAVVLELRATAWDPKTRKLLLEQKPAPLVLTPANIPASVFSDAE